MVKMGDRTVTRRRRRSADVERGVKLHAAARERFERRYNEIPMELAGSTFGLGLTAGSAHSQILQNLENAITGERPSQADIAAAREEVQAAARAR